MRLIGKKKLEKLKRKNRGNTQLGQAIDNLINDIEGANWTNEEELKAARSDADGAHNDGFYFFNPDYALGIVMRAETARKSGCLEIES